jgi:hypothetical protein
MDGWIRPGLLQRGADSRFSEKVMNAIMSGTPVETVARAMRLHAEATIAPPASPHFVIASDKDIRAAGRH